MVGGGRRVGFALLGVLLHLRPSPVLSSSRVESVPPDGRRKNALALGGETHSEKRKRTHASYSGSEAFVLDAKVGRRGKGQFREERGRRRKDYTNQ